MNRRRDTPAAELPRPPWLEQRCLQRDHVLESPGPLFRIPYQQPAQCQFTVHDVGRHDRRRHQCRARSMLSPTYNRPGTPSIFHSATTRATCRRAIISSALRLQLTVQNLMGKHAAFEYGPNASTRNPAGFSITHAGLRPSDRSHADQELVIRLRPVRQAKACRTVRLQSRPIRAAFSFQSASAARQPCPDPVKCRQFGSHTEEIFQ